MAKQTQAPPTRRQAAAAPPARGGKANVPATQAEKKQAVQNGDLPADLAAMMDQDAGRGLSQDASDNLIPLIYILQPLSPQVLRGNAAQIQGAEPGDIWLRNSNDPVHKEIWFQPCHFSKDWVEWIPRARGGGYAGRHPEKPAEAKEFRDPENPQSIRWRLPNGNDVVETRYYGGNVWLPDVDEPLPYIIPLSSTGHTFGKAWMVTMNQRRTPNGGKAPSFSSKYHLVTSARANNKGEWYMFENDDVEWCNADEYAAGKSLADALESGAKVAEAPLGSEAGEVVQGDNNGRM